MRHRTASSILVSCLLAATACTTSSQSAPTSLPTPLADALIDDRGLPTRSAREFSVGKLPRGYPATLVPSGPVTIVGGMTTGDAILAIFADSTRRLAAVFEQLFEQTGFTRPPPSPGSGFTAGSGPYSYSCSDSAMVSVEPLTGTQRNLARVSYRRIHGRAACPFFDRGQSVAELPLPELTPPPGVRVTRSLGGSSSDGVNSGAEVRGIGLVPSTILAHYAAQLVAAGWNSATPAISERVAAQFFEAKTASGARWEGVLMAFGSETSLTLSLSMRRHAP